VTLWVGASRVIVAVEMPGIEPGDIAVSVLGDSLTFRGAGRLDFSLDVPLPCAVEVNPVILTKGKDFLCVLLMKKQEADRVTAEGYGDRDLPVPVLMMDGAQGQR
jgi:HSP20 family molecular chaperone IbpA